MNWPEQAEAFYQLAQRRGLRAHPRVVDYLCRLSAAGRAVEAGVACSGGADSLALLLWLYADNAQKQRQRQTEARTFPFADVTADNSCADNASVGLTGDTAASVGAISATVASAANGCSLRVLHLNHNLRGECSLADAAFVQEVANELGLPFFGECVTQWGSGTEVATFGENESPPRPLHGGACLSATTEASVSSSIPAPASASSNLCISEERLRAARHAFFERSGCGVIFQGHHRGDVAETMLMRLSAGSGIDGLCAPRPVSERGEGRPVFLRPLLDWDKAVIESMLGELGIPWRQDASNAEGVYFRNRVRARVLPALQAAAGARDVAAALVRSRDLLQEDAEALGQWLENVWPLAWQPSASVGGLLDWRVFAPLPRAVQRRALWRWLGLCGVAASFTSAALEALLRTLAGCDPVLAGAGKALRVSAGASHFVCCKDGVLGLESAGAFHREAFALFPAPSQPGAVAVLQLPGGDQLTMQAFGLTAELHGRIVGGAFSSKSEVYLALAAVTATAASSSATAVDHDFATIPQLAVRYWQRGDAYRPLGSPGRRKVQDCFTDRKIPRELRHRLPVVVDALSGEIVWVVSLPPAQQYALGDGTKSALRLTYESLCKKI